jgi:hypothetical protein
MANAHSTPKRPEPSPPVAANGHAREPFRATTEERALLYAIKSLGLSHDEAIRRMAPHAVGEGAPEPSRGDARILRLASQLRDRLEELAELEAAYYNWDEDDTDGAERHWYTKVEPAEAAVRQADDRFAGACKRYGRARAVVDGLMYLTHGAERWRETRFCLRHDCYPANVAGLPREGGAAC